MNKTDISVQLYTARKFKPYKDILKFISSMGIKNIELFALSDFDEKELKDLLQKYNLTSISAHVSFESFENLKDVINKIKYLGVKHAIIPAPKVIPQKDFNASGLKHISKKMLTNLSWTQIYRGFDPDPYLRGMFVSRLLGLDGYYFHDRLAIGTMLLLPGVMYPFHTHDVNELYYCISGKLEIRHTVSGLPFFLKSGDLSITPKAQLHSLSVLGNKPVLLFYFLLSHQSH